MSDGPEILLTLYLIRHAQSLRNAGFQPGDDATDGERFDSPLSQTGLKQAAALGMAFSDVSLDAIYTSGLERALQTAEAIAARKTPAMPVTLLPDLAEIRLGSYQGRAFAELKDAHPSITLAPGLEPGCRTVVSEGQDDDAAILARARRAVAFLRSVPLPGQTVAAVSHGGLITNAIFDLLGFGDCVPPADFTIDNACVTKVTFYTPGTFRDDVVIEYVNYSAHLGALWSKKL